MITKAVLFDLDGVIVDSKTMHHNSWCFALKEILGVTVKVFPEAKASGKSPQVIAQTLCKLYGDGSKQEYLLSCKNSHLENHCENMSLLPGVLNLFKLLRAKNIPFGIASNASKHFVSKCIETCNLKISHFYGYEDYKQAKPNPEPYQKLALKLGIATEDFNNVFVFEDSQPGIIAALNANMKVIHIESYCFVSQDLKVKASYTFNNVGEAISLFE